MRNYVHDNPVKLYFGEGQIENLGSIVTPLGKTVLLAYGGGSIKRNGLYDSIMKIMNENGCKVVELAGVEPNPRITSVQKGVDLCKEHGVEVVLAVGGGSTIDCAKAICSGYYYDGDLWTMCNSRHGKLKSLPLVTIVTIAATGSEFDSGAVISNMDTNQKVCSSFTFPTASICDPTYTYSVSKYQTAAGAADIMSHTFEDYLSHEIGTELSEGLSETLLKTVMKYCPIALADPTNYEARANLMASANIACASIAAYGKRTTGWPCHMIEHELSAYYDITHGVGLAILTPRWMRFILAKDPTIAFRIARFGRNVLNIAGTDDMAVAKEAIDALEAYFKSTGIPMTLTELNIGEENFTKMAEAAMKNGYLHLADVPLTVEDIVEILKACL